MLILLSGISLAFSAGGFVVNFKTVGFSLLSELQKGVFKVADTVTGTFTALHDMANLQEQYDALAEKVKDYEYLQRSNAEIRKENERLREQLGFARSVQYRNVAAQIIGRGSDNMYSGITIDKGARSGIKKGMPVIAIQDGNIGVVGKVVTVGMDTGIVMPLYDTNCNISARIQNTRDLGLASGNGSENVPLSFNYIRKRLYNDIHYGDVVVTSGENGNFMRDIPLGTIVRKDTVDYDSSLVIELKSIIDFSRLETVLIVDLGYRNDKLQSIVQSENSEVQK